MHTGLWQPLLTAVAGASIGWLCAQLFHTDGTEEQSQLGDTELRELSEKDVRRLFRGELLPTHRVSPLRSSCFSAWESLSENLPQLNQRGQLRDAVATLPVLPAAQLRYALSAR